MMKTLHRPAAMESERADNRWGTGFALRASGFRLRQHAPEPKISSPRGLCCCAQPDPIILNSIGDRGQASPKSENTPALMNARRVSLIRGAFLAGCTILS